MNAETSNIFIPSIGEREAEGVLHKPRKLSRKMGCSILFLQLTLKPIFYICKIRSILIYELS